MTGNLAFLPAPGMPAGIPAIPFSTYHHWQAIWKIWSFSPFTVTWWTMGASWGKKIPHFLGQADSGEHSHWCPKIPPLWFALEIPTKHLLQLPCSRTNSLAIGNFYKMPSKLSFSSLKGLTCCLPKLKLAFLIFLPFFFPLKKQERKV